MAPKEINAENARTALVDALCDVLHVAVAEGAAEAWTRPLDEQSNIAEQIAANEVADALPSALTHFWAERNKDDLCPEGVVVVGLNISGVGGSE